MSEGFSPGFSNDVNQFFPARHKKNQAAAL